MTAAAPRPAARDALLPAKPVLSCASFRGSSQPALPSVLDLGEALPLTSGRAAIANALELLGAGPGDRVLVPAYHCPSMVQPVLWRGAAPVFYRIAADCRVDQDDLQSKMRQKPVALLLPHLFGFPQHAAAIRSLCDQHGVALVEDCAHAFFGEFNGHPPGWFGDFAVASATKFFPVADGGYLASRLGTLAAARIDVGGLLYEAKVAVNALETAFRSGRMPLLAAVARLPIALRKLLGARNRRGAGAPPRATHPSAAVAVDEDFDPGLVHVRMSKWAQLTVSLADKAQIAAGRRRNYARLLDALGGLPGVRPLHPQLPPGVVPYVLPLVVDAADEVYPVLRQQRIPVFRWDILAPGVSQDSCGVSWNYSRCLLQIPCHDSFTEAELERLADSLRAVFERCAAGRSASC